MEITNCQEFTGSPKINYDLIWISKILRTNIKYGMTTFHIAAKLDTIEMPILLIQPLLTYFIFLHIVVIQQSVYLFKIYGHNLPTEKVRKITSVLCSWRKLRVSSLLTERLPNSQPNHHRAKSSFQTLVGSCMTTTHP